MGATSLLQNGVFGSTQEFLGWSRTDAKGGLGPLYGCLPEIIISEVKTSSVMVPMRVTPISLLLAPPPPKFCTLECLECLGKL